MAIEGPKPIATGWVLTTLHFDRPVSWTLVNNGVSASLQYEIGDAPETFLTVGLRFYTSSGKASDVSTLVAPLDMMAAVDPQLKRPMIVVLQIGALSVQGVISSISETYSNYLVDGTATHCEVEVKMKVAAAARLKV